MGLNYEPVKLEHLGRGGTAEDVALVDEVEQKLAHLSMLVIDDKADGEGSLTIKIRVKKMGEESVLLAYSIAAKEPPMRRKALSAIVAPSTGELFSAQHKQEALPLPKPVPLRANGAESSEGGEP